MRAFIGTVSPFAAAAYAAVLVPLALPLLTSAAAMAAPAPSGGEGQCVAVPREAENPPVTACETATEYIFTVTGERSVYDKETYRAALRSAVEGWYADVSAPVPAGARLEFWLAVPEANPAGTMARVALVDGSTETGDASPSVVFFVGIAPTSWHISNADVAILEDGAYPDSFGHRVSEVLVKTSPDAKQVNVDALLEAHGGTDPEPFAPSWSSYVVPAFAEAETAANVLADPKSRGQVARIELNQIVEWIARRERAFAFSLAEP